MSQQSPDDLKISSGQKAAWDDSAEGWRRWWPAFERAAQLVNDKLVALAQVRAGSRVLDIATGSGEPALTAARVCGTSGRVVAVDLSAGMLAIARERIDAARLANVELVESDAASLAFDSHSFDAALCRWGLMFMPDLDGVLRGLHRVLKPGARFATAVWSSGSGCARSPLRASRASRRSSSRHSNRIAFHRSFEARMRSASSANRNDVSRQSTM